MASDERPISSDRDSLRGSLRSIVRGWPVIVLCAAVAGAASFLYSGDEAPEYVARVSLAVNSLSAYQAALVGGGAATDAERQLRTASDLIRLPVIGQRVSDRVGRDVAVGASIQAIATSKSDILQIQAKSPRPRSSVDVANAAARVFIRFRREQLAKSVGQARHVLQDQTRAAQTKADRRVLVGKRNNLAALQALQDQQFAIVQPAVASAAADNPRQRTVLIAVVLGLLVGTALTLLRDPARP